MKKWFVLAVAATLASVCLAQKMPTAKQEPKKASLAKFSIGMLESDRIQPGYAGTTAAGLVGAIEKLAALKKGEFESTADFDARKTAALAGRLLGEATLEDTFAFVLPVFPASRYGNGLKYEFNADTSQARLFVLPKSLSINGIGASAYEMRAGNSLDQLGISFKTDSRRAYQASNAYGASITVVKTDVTQLGIAANRMPFLRFERESTYSNPMPVAWLPMENAKAAKELPAMKALVVMKLAAPYLVHDLSHSTPTRDEPTEISVRSKYLTGDALGIVFYSGLTGEVFARLPEDFGKTASKTENQ